MPSFLAADALRAMRRADGLVVQVLRARGQFLGGQKRVSGPRPRRAFDRHAVPGDEPQRGERGRSRDARPGELVQSQEGRQPEVEPHGGDAGEQREDALPKRHAEEHPLGILAYLSVDLHFHFLLLSACAAKRARKAPRARRGQCVRSVVSGKGRGVKAPSSRAPRGRPS